MCAVATFSYIYECGYNERELKDYSANLGMEKLQIVGKVSCLLV